MAETISSLVGDVVQAMSTRNDNKIEAAKEAVVNVVKETVVKEVIHDTLNVDVSGLATKADVETAIYDDTGIKALINEKANASDIPDVSNFIEKDSLTKISNTNGNIKDFIGVSENEVADIELSATDKASGKGTRLQISKVDGIYYTKNSMSSSSLQSNREIAVKGDIPDVSNFITAEAIPDVSGFAAKENVDIELAKKADKTNLVNSTGCIYNKYVNSSNGHALLFNETDGGGSQVLDKTANVQSYVGTNLDEGNANKDTAVNVQIYSIDATSKDGVRININKNKAYYLAGTRSMSDDKEIAVKGDIPDVSALISRIEELEAKVAALEAKE